MKIEQIVSYLMVSTVIVIFAMIVLYTSMASVGNGGEYWGYDGEIRPRYAAYQAFENGDRRFLAVTLPPHDNRFTDFTPGVGACANLPDSIEATTIRSSSEPLHAQDSLRLATKFAREYNRDMAWSLNSVYQADCEVLRR